MDIPPEIVRSGEAEAWSRLEKAGSTEVARKAGARKAGNRAEYVVPCFSSQAVVDVGHREIGAEDDQVGQWLVGELGELFRLSVLWYLTGAKDVDCTGRLVHPNEIPGGDMFQKGTHILPLGRLAKGFDRNPDELIRVADDLKAERVEFGDRAFRLWPFPKVPVVLVLWAGDEEFKPRASLLFDSTCHLHLPGDILWSTAMVSLELIELCHRRLQEGSAGFK